MLGRTDAVHWRRFTLPIPSYEKLMPMVLRLATEERRLRDAVTIISDELHLTTDEREETIPSGPTTMIYSRVAWAVTYLVQAGLLKRPKRGHFVISEHGQSVLNTDLQNLNLAYIKKIPAFIDFMNRKGSRRLGAESSETVDVSTGDKSPEEIIGAAYQELEADLKEQALERILQNSPAFFENLVVRLLSSLGYGRSDTLAEVMGKVGDGGIDGIIHQDKLGLDVVYIQAKRYAPDNTVSRPELQAFVGTLAGVSAHKGVFVTTSRFSPGALDYLKTVNARVITIDGLRLVDLMIESGVGVRTRKVFELHRVDEDFFLEE
jgi:restriction system protein